MKKRMLILGGITFATFAMGLLFVIGPNARPKLAGEDLLAAENPLAKNPMAGDRSIAEAVAATGVAEEEGNTVVLSGDRLKAAQLETAVVERRRLVDVRYVPGRLEYDDSLHVAVKSPTDGVLTQVLVKPGDQVESGQILAWLESSEIGTARAEMLLRRSENELVGRTLLFKTAVHDNVQQLISALRVGEDFQALRKQFVGLVMGQYRESLFGAYSRLLLAESLLESARSLGDSGGLAGRTIRERTSEVQAAEAAVNAVCEQAEFDTRTQRDQARMAADDAQRRMRISQQHLAALLMSPGHLPMGVEPVEAASANRESPASTSEWEPDGTSEIVVDEQRLSRVAIRAPIAGTIEARKFSATERVRTSDTLFVVADTGRLWVAADIRENEWSALQLAPGAEITVTTPALPQREFKARVYFVGREVARGTNAIPLVAVIDNSDDLLRPGLFVRVGLPVDVKENVIAVPLSAVVQHEGLSFVFIERQPGHFQRVDVQPGFESSQWLEVPQGIKPGDRVVTRGAFLLKSELLLAGEQE